MDIPSLHKRDAPKTASAAIITVSSRFSGEKGDAGGDLIERMLKDAHIQVVSRDRVPDELELITERIRNSAEKADLIITTGGTGLSKDDFTVEAAHPLFDKELKAFHVLFTQLSHGQIGSSAVMSNATAGIIGNSVCFCLPGSPDACRLALEKIILPEISHIKQQVRK
ncbi:MAG: molybdenum cofactor biosynthesis protein MoaB [Nanoarchaeota archaeon]|nr:molybdenum cofactor biosynthesis protein MoaB [Nanoarchaeota archaeon]